MIKKSLIVGGAALLLMGLFFGRDAFSLVTTSVSEIQQTVKDSVPTDMRIKQARQAIKDLDPEIERNMHLIAKEKIEVAKLEKEVNKCTNCLSKDRSDIFRLKEILDTDSSNLEIAGRTYTVSQVKTDLTNPCNPSDGYTRNAYWFPRTIR